MSCVNITLSALGCLGIKQWFNTVNDNQHIETTIVTATRTEQSVADNSTRHGFRRDIERGNLRTYRELLSLAVGVAQLFTQRRPRRSNNLLLRGNQSNHALKTCRRRADQLSFTLGSRHSYLRTHQTIRVCAARSSLYGSSHPAA
jgi:outer membrane cobalamin receptor